MSLAQTPPGLPLTRRLPRRGSLVGAAGGVSLLAKVRDAGPAPQAGHAWSTFGPHAIGTERFATVSSDASLRRSQLRSWKQAPVQNPDKDEGAGPSPARPTNRFVTSRNAGRSASGASPIVYVPFGMRSWGRLPILRWNNPSEQSLRGPTVAAKFWMAGCTAMSERIPVLDHSAGLVKAGSFLARPSSSSVAPYPSPRLPLSPM